MVLPALIFLRFWSDCPREHERGRRELLKRRLPCPGKCVRASDRGVRRSGRYVRSGVLEVGSVKLVERFPVPGVRFGVVGQVVGHRESVAGGIELQGVVDSGTGERVSE